MLPVATTEYIIILRFVYTLFYIYAFSVHYIRVTQLSKISIYPAHARCALRA